GAAAYPLPAADVDPAGVIDHDIVKNVGLVRAGDRLAPDLGAAGIEHEDERLFKPLVVVLGADDDDPAGPVDRDAEAAGAPAPAALLDVEPLDLALSTHGWPQIRGGASARFGVRFT